VPVLINAWAYSNYGFALALPTWLSARKGDPPGEPGSASKMDPPQPHPFQ
jgi:hypothetical protein